MARPPTAIVPTRAAAVAVSAFPARRSIHADGIRPMVKSVRTATSSVPVGQCMTSVPPIRTTPARVAPRPEAASSAVVAIATIIPSASALSRYALLVRANGIEETTATA